MKGKKLGLVGRVILGVGALANIFSGNAKAGYFDTMFKNPGMNNSVLGIWHVNGATEGYGFRDVTFSDGPEPALDIYSRPSIPSDEKLAVDARPPTSMTTITSEISGRGLTSPKNAKLNFLFYDIGEDNFSWKNIIGELYQRIDDGKGSYKYALIDDYDIKNIMVRSDPNIYISITNGITKGSEFFPSHKLNYKFFNHADLNRDRKVNFNDWAIFSNEWRKSNATDPNRFGIYVGADVNDLGAYADMDRSGFIDHNDTELFVNEWLWDADDPNTW